jgi:hypothetical protein
MCVIANAQTLFGRRHSFQVIERQRNDILIGGIHGTGCGTGPVIVVGVAVGTFDAAQRAHSQRAVGHSHGHGPGCADHRLLTGH